MANTKLDMEILKTFMELTETEKEEVKELMTMLVTDPDRAREKMNEKMESSR